MKSFQFRTSREKGKSFNAFSIDVHKYSKHVDFVKHDMNVMGGH